MPKLPALLDERPKRRAGESNGDYAKRVMPHECENPSRHYSEQVVSDFSYRDWDDLNKFVPNFMCHRCGAHVFKDKFYTNAEWEVYVNTPEEK